MLAGHRVVLLQLDPLAVVDPVLGGHVGVAGSRGGLQLDVTTFSALTVDVADMARDGDWGFAVGYLAASVAGGVALALVGAALRTVQLKEAQ